MSALAEAWRAASPALFDGLGVSLAVTGAALALGLPLGLLLALGLRARDAPLRWASRALVGAGRGAPALVLLQAAGLGLPAAGLPLPPFAAAALALGWAAGAHAGVAVRAGLDAVPPGQREAAAVLGLSAPEALRFVLLPEGLRAAAPALLGVAVLVFQASSLSVAIALPDLASRATRAGATVPVLVMACLLYAAVCAPALLAAARLERRRRRPAA